MKLKLHCRWSFLSLTIFLYCMIQAKNIRRARVMEDGEWRLIKPGQEWDDGEVRCTAGRNGPDRAGAGTPLTASRIPVTESP